MCDKQLGIVGSNYNLNNYIFEKILNLTNAKKDQDNIIINLIYCEKEKIDEIDELISKCEYLKSIGTTKIIITEHIKEKIIKNIQDEVGIEITNTKENLDLLVKEFVKGD